MATNGGHATSLFGVQQSLSMTFFSQPDIKGLALLAHGCLKYA